MSKIRIFTLNANNKIELTEKELRDLLDEAYRDGASTVTITTPSNPWWSQPYYTTTTTVTADSVTMTSEPIDGLTSNTATTT